MHNLHELAPSMQQHSGCVPHPLPLFVWWCWALVTYLLLPPGSELLWALAATPAVAMLPLPTTAMSSTSHALHTNVRQLLNYMFVASTPCGNAKTDCMEHETNYRVMSSKYRGASKH